MYSGKCGVDNSSFMNSIDEVPEGRKPTSFVYVFNMSEDVWQFIQTMSDKKARDLELAWNARLSERELFTLVDVTEPIVFVSPTEVREEFLNYFKSLFGNKDIRVIVPKGKTGETSLDCMNDEKALTTIVAAANGAKRLTVVGYATTPQFLKLVRVLRERGLNVFTPETPEEEDAWTVNFFGTKSGIRQLAQKSVAQEPDFMMADGLICVGVEDAAKIAARKYVEEHGVVIKTNKGHSGVGVLLFQEGELPGVYEECRLAIDKILAKDIYWEKFPIIIESYIPINQNIGGGCPNVEYRIHKSGRIEFLYYCGMRMTKTGEFQGVEINQDVISDQVGAQMVDTGFFIAEQYAKTGYRGYFDVDFVAARNGKLFVTESNVRRTGGTFVYHVAEKLFGKDFLIATYILSNNSHDFPGDKKWTFPQLSETLSDVLFQKKTGEGVVLVSSALLELGKFGYIVFGANKRRAYEIEEEMMRLLS